MSTCNCPHCGKDFHAALVVSRDPSGLNFVEVEKAEPRPHSPGRRGRPPQVVSQDSDLRDLSPRVRRRTLAQRRVQRAGMPLRLSLGDAAAIAGCSEDTYRTRAEEGIYPQLEDGKVWSDVLYAALGRGGVIQEPLGPPINEAR